MPTTESNNEVWILGATGRVGRATAPRIAVAGLSPVLVGRDAARLERLADGIDGGARTVAVDSIASLAAAIESGGPDVVVNTIGPFSQTAPTIARACLVGGSDYLDLANDIPSVSALLALDDEAIAAGRTVVTGAGFGFLATEAAVSRVCEGRPNPDRVWIDALPSVAVEAGALGYALAASLLDSLVAGGRRYEGGRLVKARIGGDPRKLTTPDGDELTVGGAPSGDLLAAWLVAGAPSVSSTSTEVPSGNVARALLPVVAAVLRIGALRRFAIRRLAATELKPRPRPRAHSWGHAVAQWQDGTRRESWLRAGEDAMDFTADAVTAVAVGLARGSAHPGAFTPVGALGPEVAVAAGGEFLDDESATA